MRKWVRAAIARRCGGADATAIAVGEPLLEVQSGGGPILRRCRTCAARDWGEQPPADLQPLPVYPSLVPQLKLPLRVGNVLPFDFKTAQAEGGRDPGEEG